MDTPYLLLLLKKGYQFQMDLIGAWYLQVSYDSISIGI